jgi:diguanylate cyclase (GGDEF)-like protein/putative nucleotidyltransferase with HDIG domain
MKTMNLKAKAYIAMIAMMGAFTLFYGAVHWQSQDLVRLLCYVAIAVAASSLKVSLPGITGTMSVNFLFILLGIAELSLSETLAVGCSAILVQCIWNARMKPLWLQISFNVSSVAIAIFLSYLPAHYLAAHLLHNSLALLLVAAACIYFLANTLPVAGVISLTEGKSFRKIWKECYFWSFPYYLVGAAIAGLVSTVNRSVGWQTSLLILPVIYWIFRSYRLYLGRLEDEKRHVEDMASLHLRTIEALALAIEAKDHNTHDHLQRVRIYAIEIAKELKVSHEEIEALRAAALLHDIGKLAVPEHIISKPGKLTPEEFEKMKIHPLVGAEILERVKFPYPVVPIVRAHHEKWDGTGYPYGLAAEQIPIGARILSAVDCLDALASDRQYRRALPLDQAMARVASDAGKAFDPKVVEILQRRYVELEGMARAQSQDHSQRLSTAVRVEKGAAPAEGFEASSQNNDATSIDFLSSIAAARQEAQMLFELSQTLGNSLSLDETLSVLSVRLKRLVPYDSLAIYIRKEKHLVPEFVTGENFRLFSTLQIPIGEGLSGWVAANRMPIVNGNPSVEPGYDSHDEKFSQLRSALAVPLEGLNGVMGVLALYRADKDAFNKDHLRVLLAISSKLALSVENALKYQLAENSATTDYLTGLPNARSLFLHLDRELARCKRLNTPLTILVCDLDGFKQINDRFGHLEGNKVLRIMARGLSEACREYDYVARMGGDEFVVVVPGMTPEHMDAKVKQFQRIAESAGIQVCGDNLLSLSVGQAHYPQDGIDAEQLLAEADRRMYLAKREHYSELRNRARVADPKSHEQLLM